MELAIFDLDNTLLDGDSDYLWGRFLVENNYIDTEEYQQQRDRYYEDYLNGTLDIYKFLKFQLRCLAENDLPTLLGWRERFIKEKIHPIILPNGKKLIERHRQRGNTLLIITSTNSFITEPIAELLGIDNLIATEPEILNGQYTGKPVGEPAFAEGKVIRYQQWLEQKKLLPRISFFYSDSHNDIPMLNHVTHPIVVHPDEKLKVEARRRHWKTISLQ